MAKFSRGHYVLIAKVAKAISEVRDMALEAYNDGKPYDQEEILEAIELTLAAMFKADDSKFNRERFLQASRGDHGD